MQEEGTSGVAPGAAETPQVAQPQGVPDGVVFGVNRRGRQAVDQGKLLGWDLVRHQRCEVLRRFWGTDGRGKRRRMAIVEYEGLAGQRKVFTSRLVMCDRTWLRDQPAGSLLTLALFVRHPILLSRLTRHYLSRIGGAKGTHTGDDRTWDTMFDVKWKRGRLRREAEEIKRLREKYQGGIE